MSAPTASPTASPAGPTTLRLDQAVRLVAIQVRERCDAGDPPTAGEMRALCDYLSWVGRRESERRERAKKLSPRRRRALADA